MADDARRVMTQKFRASYVNVFEARSFQDGGDAKYGLTMLFDKSADLSDLRAAYDAAIAEKWGNKPPKTIRSPFRDGNEKADEWDGYEDQIFVRASTKQRPGVLGPDAKPISDPADFYSGAYGRATVKAYAYDHKGNRGVSFELHNVQKISDGEPLTGRRRAEDDFEPIEQVADDSVADLVGSMEV